MPATSPQVQPLHPKAKQVRANSLLAAEGDPAGGWYILISGRVGVFKGAHLVSEFSQRGCVFGEISSILNKPRSASLIALEDSQVLYVPADLDQLVKHHPAIAKKIMVNLAERLVKTTDLLWQAMDHEAAQIIEPESPVNRPLS